MIILILSIVLIFPLQSYSWAPGTEFPCPDEAHLFDPCHCSVVSFDSVNYYSQITCSGVNGKQIKEAFHRAYHYHNISRYYDILMIKDVALLNICCDDMLEGFRFKTIKITDSKICVIHANAFTSTHGQTSEIVLMDVTFTPNLVDGVQLFRVVRNFANLRGFYIITSNLEDVPANAFSLQSNSHGNFGNQLEVIRICNSKITHLHDYTFTGLPRLVWIDFGDNQINRVAAHTFTLSSHQYTEAPLEISLSGNRLTSENIEPGSFDNNLTRPVTIYLNSNKLTTLSETTFETLLRRPNYIVYVESNPFICDCRHRWLFNHKEDNMYHLKEMKCVEDGTSIWSKNLPNVCDRSRLVVEPPGVEVFRKCCRKIKYDRDHSADDHRHETHIHPLPARQVYYHPPHHHHHQQQQQQREYLIIPQQRPVREYLVQSEFVEQQQRHFKSK